MYDRAVATNDTILDGMLGPAFKGSQPGLAHSRFIIRMNAGQQQHHHFPGIRLRLNIENVESLFGQLDTDHIQQVWGAVIITCGP